MKGLLQLGKLEEEMPLVYDWLKHAESTRRLVKENYGNYSGEELLEITIAENVLTQIENLKTYPVIHSKLYQGKLQIYGWIYLLETGEVLAYDPVTHAYITPQTQLDHSESGQYIMTSAPPLACDLPNHDPEPHVDADYHTAASYQRDRENGASRDQDGDGKNIPGGITWLSPEQADRIYRGSSARKH